MTLSPFLKNMKTQWILKHFFMMTEVVNVMHGNQMQSQIKIHYLLISI